MEGKDRAEKRNLEEENVIRYKYFIVNMRQNELKEKGDVTINELPTPYYGLRFNPEAPRDRLPGFGDGVEADARAGKDGTFRQRLPGFDPQAGLRNA